MFWRATHFELTTALAFHVETTNPRPKPQSPEAFMAQLSGLPVLPG